MNDRLVEYLRMQEGRKFTARELAQWYVETYPRDCAAKQARSRAKVIPLNTPEAFTQQIIAEIGSHRPILENKYGIKTTETRPRLFYFSQDSDEVEIQKIENEKQEKKQDNAPHFTEHDLYPLLAAFLETELGVHTKRIDEKRSSNTRGPSGNKWLYPDLVGLQDLAADWEREVRECAEQHKD